MDFKWGKKLMDNKYKKSILFIGIFVMMIFLRLLLILSIGCGVNRLEDQETEDISFADTEGWEFQGEKLQYLWGTWDVSMGGTGENNKEYWGTYEILPDSTSFRSEITKVEDCDIQVSEYTGAPVLARYRQMDTQFDLPGTYYLMIGIRHENPDPFTELFLVDKNLMVGFSGRTPFVLKKIEDYTSLTESGNFMPTEYGFWCGEWKVTESLKADSEDAEQYIGMCFDTDSKDSDRKKITAVYLAATDEASIEKLVEAMQLKEEAFIIFWEFSEDCLWDKMVMKDENTVVLVRDGNYFWAKRVSEIDDFGAYGAYI